jgi:integrase
MANRVYQLVRAVCRWSVREELLPSNPCEALQRPRREHSRDRVLKDEEIVALWKALDGDAGEVSAEPSPVSGVVKALLLLGQRSSETIQMRRIDLDLVAKTWTIPGSFRKGGRSHFVPLSPLAVEIL